MNTYYSFTKDGRTYHAKGANRFEAQFNAELASGIKLTGATYEVVYKLKVIRTGIVR